MKSRIEQHIQNSISAKQSLLAQSDLISEIAKELTKVIQQGGTIYSCGNGGSACDAMHFTEELVARYERDREGIRAAHFCDPGVITCWANDYSYQDVFARQVRTFVRANDALIVFSTSGNSENIIHALEAAKSIGCLTIGFLGKSGGEASKIVQYPLIVASHNTANIQEAHITLIHLLCAEFDLLFSHAN